jgi:predicted ATP-grasp superfamily ATP-dependent carboligase
MVRSRTANGPGDSTGGVAVILTGGEHLSVLAAVRALGAAGYAPWVAVHERGAYAARSRATAGIIEVPSPWDDARGFVTEIAEAAERIQAAVVLPGTEYGMSTLAQHAGDLPAGVVLGTGPLSAIANATDKGKLAGFARKAGLRVPPTADIGLSTIPARLPFPFPVVVKPHRSEHRGVDGVVRHVGARYVDSSQDLRAALAALPGERGLVQPFLHGPMGSFAGVFWDDQMVCPVQSRGDRLWPAPCGSLSHAETVPLDPRLAEAVTRLLRSVGWNGLFQMDFFESAGEFIVTDLNPRFYTSLSHATRAGLNLPGIWVDLLRGQVPNVPASYRIGVHYRHDEGDLRALARMFVRGQRAAALGGLIPHRDTAHAVFSITDPAPLMTSLSRLVRHASRRVERPFRTDEPRPAGARGGAASPTNRPVSDVDPMGSPV